MDEDDRFAIATRNLIAEHDFFNAYLEEEKEGATTTICDFKLFKISNFGVQNIHLSR